MKRLSEEEKKRIIELYMNGKSVREIAEITNTPKSTVNYVIQKHKENNEDVVITLAKELDSRCKEGIDGAKEVINALSE